MAGQIYTVTYTVGLIDKLAGKKKPEKPAPKPAPQGPPQPYLHPEVLALKQHDASLNRALARSKRVGDALLKAEEEESATIKQLGNELLSKNSFTIKPRPCQTEEAACLSCYQANPEDPLKCAGLVDAYYACANKAHLAATARRHKA